MPAAQPAKVGLYVSPPFVMREKSRFTGMAIELWEALAAKLGLAFKYQEFPTVSELIEATARGDIDIAVTNLTITERRAQRIDFTHPWYDAGLRIMVNDEQGAGFWEVVTGLHKSGFLRTYAMLAGVVVLATVLLTLFDRKFDLEFPRRWRDGLAGNFYHVMSVATSGRAPGRKNPFGWLGTIWSALWLISGVAVLAYVTSTVTSVMTAISLTSQIHGVTDLPGRTVGVFTGSVAEEYARAATLDARSFNNIDLAVAALMESRIDAIIGDAPVLEYYAHNHPELPITVVGAIFEPDKYGFGLPRQSSLTRPLTLAIIAAHENKLLETLGSKYFSDPP